ncbi:hypothetical protein BWZ20_06310 [Winogradskyella sp. J14-2]|nr:hypothetical protein BWZ20_06310 [Winogradskyella sp. J14-2]
MTKQILDNHFEVYTAPELGFYNPYSKSVYKYLSNTDHPAVEDLKKISPKFIQFTEELNNVNTILKKKEPKTVFKELMFQKANINKSEAKIIGAKFPFHFSFLSKFKRWYPNSKIIFLVRDPRAICSSEIIMKTKIKGSSKFPILKSDFVNRKTIMLYVLIQMIWYSIILKKYSNSNDAIIIKYENLLSNSEGEIKRLCNFLSIAYSDALLQIKVKGSSYNREQTKGISKHSVEKWKHNLKPDEKFLIKLCKPFYSKVYNDYFSS